jgi:hypothetical protein
MGPGCVTEVGLGEGEGTMAGESTAGVLALAGKEKREESFTVVDFKEKEEIEVLREWDRRCACLDAALTPSGGKAFPSLKLSNLFLAAVSSLGVTSKVESIWSKRKKFQGVESGE